MNYSIYIHLEHDQGAETNIYKFVGIFAVHKRMVNPWNKFKKEDAALLTPH